jgi:hypothetical protein
MPEQAAVVAMTGESSNMQGELDLVWEHLLPAMKDRPLPADRQSQGRLEQTLAALALAPPKGQPAPPLAVGSVAEMAYRVESNELGFERAALAFGKDGCVFTLKDAQTEYPIACGLEQWRRGKSALPGTPPRLVSGGAPKRGTKSKYAASAAWKDQNTLELTLRYYETPHHDTVTCRFDGGQVTIAFLSSIAKVSPTPKDPRPVLRGKMV